ncbi:MAG TPA: AMP-binding protein [Steroidobacteraceae bacterium]|nr:AMP-binding protein [Steroidobacteraceae bacterium]
MTDQSSAPLEPAEVIARFPEHMGTIGSFLGARTAVQPERIVLEVDERAWSYRQLEEASTLLAATLTARGLGRAARIALVSLNCDVSLILFLAAARIGAVFIPLNPAATRAELEYLLGHSRPALLVAQASDLERVREVARGLAPVPQVLSMQELGAEEPDAHGVLERLRTLGAAGPAGAAAAISPDDPVVVIYTSGTTGFPKGVVHTHRTYILAAEGFVARMHLQPTERLLTVMPFFHINALFYSFGGAIACGGTLITAPRFSASQFWGLAAESGATEFNFLAAVGNILINRARAEFDPRHRISKLYGGPISERMDRVFREEFHVPDLIEGYGMSEIPGACCNPFLGTRKPGSIGLPAVHPSLPGKFSDLRVVDEQGHDVPVGSAGELVVRTPMMFKEYLDDPEQTAAAFRDGWFLTGDLVRCDADGYFYFVARKKDIIRRRGENISGAELDRIIGDHPEVLEAAAIGVPSELGEEEILVAVVPRPGAQVNAPDLHAWCRERLAPMKVPRFIAFAETLPHTPSHRVAKHLLRRDATLLPRAFDAEKAQ